MIYLKHSARSTRLRKTFYFAQLFVAAFAIIGGVAALVQRTSFAHGLSSGVVPHAVKRAVITPPTVSFVGLRHYSRLSGPVDISVLANDDVGINRVELYVDHTLVATRNIVPSTPNATVLFNWNSAAASNGKHMVQAKAYDTEGNSESAFAAVRILNAGGSIPVPTATLTVSQSSIAFGQSSTLTWTTTNAASVTINQSIGAVAANGSRPVTPGGTITYTLAASNAAGSVTKNVTVTVGPPTGNNIGLAPGVLYQTMVGWEANAENGRIYSPNWNNYKNALFDAAVNDLGVNRLRLEIRSNVENTTDWWALWRSGQISEAEWGDHRYSIVNDNSNANSINASGFKWTEFDERFENDVLPVKQRVEARGETFWLNVNYVDFERNDAGFEHYQNPQEYAEFVLATYQHLQTKYGVVPNSWELMLEPDNGTGWFQGPYAAALKAAGDRLLANGFTPNFIGPSTVSCIMFPVYVDAIASTPGAMQYVSEFSYHRYNDCTTASMQQISNRITLHNKKAGMLELIGADYNTLHSDLKQFRNSSWQQYVLSFVDSEPDNGAQHYRINNAASTFSIQSRSKFLRQYFKFIRFGAQRIDALTGNSNFDPLAFINTNGKYVVVVKAGSGGTFNLYGLPPGLYGIKYTTASQYNVDLADKTVALEQSLTTNIPAAGVITIYAR